MVETPTQQANYVPTTWVDDQPPGTGTPLNAANLNKLEGGASNALPMRSVFAAGAIPYWNLLAGGDVQPAFYFTGNGSMQWGVGGTTATDTSLYRSAVNQLTTPGTLIVGSGITVGPATVNPLVYYAAGDAAPHFYIDANGVLRWGPGGATATDTMLSRNGANSLATDGAFYAAAGTSKAILLHTDGGIYFAPNDTAIYRLSAGTLGLISNLNASGTGSFQSWLSANGGGTHQTVMGDIAPFVGGAARSGVLFGVANDTNLYRTAAGRLKSDGMVFAGSILRARDAAAAQVTIGDDPTTPRILFGNADDTNLYRSAAGTLRTDGGLIATGPFNAGWSGTAWCFAVSTTAFSSPRASFPYNGAGGDIVFGGDTNLYRMSAGHLKTDGGFNAVGRVVANYGSSPNEMSMDTTGKFLFGGAGDSWINRFAASTLTTMDGIFGVGQASRSMLKIGGGLDHGSFGYTNGDRGIWFGDSGRFAPAPPSGGYLYCAGGNLHWMSYAGHDTTIGPV